MENEFPVRRGRRMRLILTATFTALLATFAIAGYFQSQAASNPPASGVTGSNLIYLPIVVQPGTGQISPSVAASYVVIGWNDLGMHCYDRDYSTSAVLPPYNNLWAQVIKRGNPPQIVTKGVTVEYSFPDNKDSTTKTNFWQYVQKLFGVSLAPNIGLAGKGLAGTMDASVDHFEAKGIPITEYSDSNPSVADYYQLARLVVKNTKTGQVLAKSDVVAPVSSEMRCDTCHNSPSTNFRMNILIRHDNEEHTNLAAQAQAGNPVLCSKCHADPVLGMTGQPGIPSLSAAVHEKHKEIASSCYNCHPGPSTQCLRGVMSQSPTNLTCTNCHQGGMEMLAQESRTPWLDEPRCGNCHGSRFAENASTLYRLSTGHGGLYCESCHGSTHAILPSREAPDNLQSIALQGHPGVIDTCTVCHLTQPSHGGPHN